MKPKSSSNNEKCIKQRWKKLVDLYGKRKRDEVRAMKMEDVVVVAGLVALQFVYAGNSILLSYLLSVGADPPTIVVFSSFATFLIVSPVALYFERSQWPEKLTFKFIVQLIFIAFGGVTLFQSLMLKGIDLTSPAMATAMPNLAPGLIFLIAWTLRLESVKLSCVYSKVKILGTLVCVGGALLMSLMHSATPRDYDTDLEALNAQKMKGCFYLAAAVFVMSSNIVLQEATLRDFPAPMTLCAATSLVGMVLTAAAQLLQQRHFQTSWPLLSLSAFIAYSLFGGVSTGACLSFSGWVMKRRGPVLVAMFSPISTLCSILLSLVFLRQTVTLGSVAGMFLMFTGLYFVLWAKGKEGDTTSDAAANAFPIRNKLELGPECPLLS